MGDVISLKSRKGTAREQLLAMVQHQAQVQGKSVAQYLRELQTQVERNGEGRSVPQPVPSRVPREKYTYLTKREVDLLFAQITDLRDRALFGAMYYFGLRASEVGLLLREYVNFRTRRIYIPRLKGGIPGEKVMTAACCRAMCKAGGMPCPISFPRATRGRSAVNALMPSIGTTPRKRGCRPTNVTRTVCATPSPRI